MLDEARGRLYLVNQNANHAEISSYLDKQVIGAIPVGSLSNYPLAAPDATAVLLSYDACGVTASTRSTRVSVRNEGKGRMRVTAQVIQSGIALTYPLGGEADTGTQPGTSGAGAAPSLSVRQAGGEILLDFSFNTGAVRSLGTATPTDFLIQSPEAVNIPRRVRVYQNYRNSQAPGSVIPVPAGVFTAEGPADIVRDVARQRLYIANSG